MKTPKQKFDEEMKQINKDINIMNAPEKESGLSNDEVGEIIETADEVEELLEKDEKEVIIDKHIGTKKIEVTQSQHMNNKLEQQRKEILAKFNSVGGLQKEKLTPFQEQVISKVLKLEESGKLSDPVLKHLVGKKIEVAKEYAELNGKIKEVQLMIVEKMGSLASACTEAQATAKTYNRDILLYVQKNPSLIEDVSSENENEG